MLEKKNYKKVYQLISNKNKYFIKLESIESNQEQIFYLELTHIIENKDYIYYTEKTLDEIKNENKNLYNINSTKELIDYFAKLTKQDCIGINKDEKLVYIVTFIDNKDNAFMKFKLVRKIDKEIEQEILKIYNKLKYYEESHENIRQKLIEIESQKLQESNSKKETMNTSNRNNKNDTKSKFFMELINRDNNISSLSNNNSKNLNNNNNDNNANFNNLNIQNNSKIMNNSSNFNILNIQNNSKIMNNNSNFNNFNIKNGSNNIFNIINSNIYFKDDADNIFKENNNSIAFNVEPKQFKEKIIFDKKNKCEILTTFILPNKHPIIAWTTTDNKQVIKTQNIDNKDDFLVKVKKAHTHYIDDLKYFYDENIKENYIISLSTNDEESLKFWKLGNECDLEIKSIIKFDFVKISIEHFCIFNNNFYSKENSYLFIYGENKDMNQKSDKYLHKRIICYKLNNELEIINWENNQKIKTINNIETINYLDTFYYKEKNELYLINCNNKNVSVVENPLNEYISSFLNNDNEQFHLSAFIVERNNTLELFDSNYNGIYIWNLNNKTLESKIFIKNSIPYDICLWNNNYLLVSSASGFMVIQINQNNIIAHLEESKDSKSHSKIRKIYSVKEGYLMVGIDIEGNLCLWPRSN